MERSPTCGLMEDRLEETKSGRRFAAGGSTQTTRSMEGDNWGGKGSWLTEEEGRRKVREGGRPGGSHHWVSAGGASRRHMREQSDSSDYD